MRSLFVCAECNVNAHVGEYYDDIFEVPDQPTSDKIPDYAAEVRERIRDLWKADTGDDEREGEPVVEVFLDAASPFNAMLIDFQVVMKEAEGITVELPYLNSPVRTTQDEEALEVIRKLEEREMENAKV